MRRAGKRKKKKRNHVEHVPSPVVSYTVATLKAKNAIWARRMLARVFLQSTGFTNGARSPARGRMDRRKFITEDKDRMGRRHGARAGAGARGEQLFDMPRPRAAGRSQGCCKAGEQAQNPSAYPMRVGAVGNEPIRSGRIV